MCLVSSCNDYNCLYITGESDYGMGLEATGNSSDVWRFHFATSFSFSLVEQLVGNNVWNTTQIGSVTLGFLIGGFIMFFRGNKDKKIYKKAFNSVSEGKYNEAIEYFMEVYETYCNDYNFIYGIAYSYYMIKDWNNSLKYLNELLILNPDNEDAINTKAGYLVHLYKFEEALDCLNQFISNHDPSPELLKNKNEIEIMNNIHSKGKIKLNIK